MSLRAAINLKCRECLYDPLSGLGNWRQQVSACTSSECPLFPVRPKSRPHTERVSRGTVKADSSTENGRTTEREGVVA
jgi:hypothetical protein